MRNLLLTISYRGTDLHGWQIQDNAVTVQEVFQNALYEIIHERPDIKGCSRTDSGVHAAAQVAHFDTEARMAADKFAIAANMHLPPDIRVLWSEECSPDFHARFSAKKKQYRYTVRVGMHADVFSRLTALQLHHVPDLAAMQRAAMDAIGTHDFRAFMSTGTRMENTVRTIEQSEWTQNGPFLVYTVTGNGFLYNMVRILVGTMLEIGFGLRAEDSIRVALETQNRSDAGPTAPAHGLLLARVCYPDFDTEEVLRRDG